MDKVLIVFLAFDRILMLFLLDLEKHFQKFLLGKGFYSTRVV